jgi:hypothetical protein
MNPHPPESLAPYLDSEGRLAIWPARKQRDRRKEALQWITDHFTVGEKYNERAVNAVIQDLHSFGNHCELRRALIDHGFMSRMKDGSVYWVVEPPGTI